MRKVFIFSICAVILICGISEIAFAQNTKNYQEMNDTLRKVVLENFDAYEKENIYRALETVHTQSPQYLPTKQVSNEIFPVYELKYELLSFRYLLTDGEFALARAVQKTSKISGPAFRNNVLDVVFVFKQEKGKWKFWNQVILGLEFLN